MNIIEIKNLAFMNKIFYPDIKVAEGEKIFIEGKSGCGKSTLLKILNKTANYTQGEIKIFGEDIESLDPLSLRKRAILCAQNVYLFDGDAYQNFEKFYEYRQKEAPTKERIDYFLKLCLFNLSDNKASTKLSGGEKNRLFLAIALSFEPQILLLDEIGSQLDSLTFTKLLENLDSYLTQTNTTSIIVNHNEAIHERFDYRIIRLGDKNGEL